MSKVWEIFENLSEIVYVSDIDSHELIYMNKRTMQEYGFNSYEDYAGKKCYEVLQGCPVPYVQTENWLRVSSRSGSISIRISVRPFHLRIRL